MLKRIIRKLAFLSLLASAASAQTAIWIGSGTTPQDWTNGANWDTGVMPDSAGAIAVVNTSTPPGAPGTAPLTIGTNSIFLGELRYDTPAAATSSAFPQVSIKTYGSLVFQGAGISVTNAGTSPASASLLFDVTSFNPADPAVPAASLDFYDHATIATAPNTTFSIGTNSVGINSNIGFHDQSSAGSAQINVIGSFSSSTVTFSEQSSADHASIYAPHTIFKDSSTAADAAIRLHYVTSSVVFQDQATAGNAVITIDRFGSVSFEDQSNAGTATVIFNQEGGQIAVKDNANTAGLTIKQGSSVSSNILLLDISHAVSDVEIKPFIVNGPATGGNVSTYGYVNVNLGSNYLRFNLSASDAPLQFNGTITGIAGGLYFTSFSLGSVIVSNPNNNYGGQTDINGVNLTLMNGRINDASIHSFGQLGGYGTVSGNLSNSVGTVMPTGTINVLGDYTQQTVLGDHPPLLLIDLGGANKLVVNGTAMLDGKLLLTGVNSLKPVGSQTIPFLTAGTVIGQFSDVSAPAFNTALLNSHIAYSSTSVAYVIDQKPFVSVASTPTQVALASQIDATLVSSTGNYRTLLSNLNSLATTAQVAEALTALAPDRYSALAENSFAASSARQAGFDRHFANWRDQQKTAYDLFFEASYRKADFDAIADLPKAESSMSGGQVGAVWSNQGFSGGLALAYETGDLNLDQAGSKANVKSLTPSVFAQYAAGPWFLNGLVAYSNDDYQLHRRIAFTGFDQTVSASPSGHRTDVGVNAGYALSAGSWTFTPQAGVLSSSWTISSFGETGAGANGLNFSGWSNSSLRSRVGAETSLRTENHVFTSRIGVLWLHEFDDDRKVGPAGFTGATGSYIAPGRKADENLVEATLGFDAKLSPGASLYATLGGIWGKNTSVTADLSLGLRWSF